MKFKSNLDAINTTTRPLSELYVLICPLRMCPENPKEKLTSRTQTRRINDFQTPKALLDLSISFSFVGAKIYNHITNANTNVKSTHFFKHKMKTHLLGQ